MRRNVLHLQDNKAGADQEGEAGADDGLKTSSTTGEGHDGAGAGSGAAGLGA